MILLGSVRDGRPVTIVGEGRRKHSLVAVDDVASFAIAAIGHPEAMNCHVPLGGPEPVSWREIAAALGRRLGRDIPVVSLAPGQPLPGLLEIVAGLMAGLDSYDSMIEMAATARRFAVRQTTLDEYLLGMLSQVSTPSS